MELFMHESRQECFCTNARFPDIIDGHSGHLVKAGARTLQTVVCGPISRREGPTTVLTTVSSPPSLPGFVKGMTDNIALSMLSKIRTGSVWNLPRLPRKPAVFQPGPRGGAGLEATAGR